MRRTLTLALAAMLALALVTTADAAKKKKHKITLNTTALAHAVTPSGNVSAGTTSDPAFGTGAISFTNGAPTMSNGKTVETITFQGFSALGSFKGTGSVTITTGSGSTPTTFTGTGTVTGGTGKYKGAKGSITTTGTIDSMNDITLHATGTLTY